MKHYIAVIALLLLASVAVAKTHHDIYNMPCDKLWLAVKDTLRNSGKYGIVGIDNAEMTASYIIGGTLGGKRINSVVLNSKDGGCELQTQTAFTGLAHDDAGDFKDRVDNSLQKLGAPAAVDSVSTAAVSTISTAPDHPSFTLTPQGEIDFTIFSQAPVSPTQHKAFAVSDNGHYGYSYNWSTQNAAKERALATCKSKSKGAPCRLVVVDDRKM